MHCNSSFLDKSKCTSVLGEHQIAYLAKDIFERINHNINGINMPERIMGGGEGSHDTYSKFEDKGVPPGLFYIKTRIVEIHRPNIKVSTDAKVMDDKMFDELFGKVMHGSERSVKSLVGPKKERSKNGTKKRRSKGEKIKE